MEPDGQFTVDMGAVAVLGAGRRRRAASSWPGAISVFKRNTGLPDQVLLVAAATDSAARAAGTDSAGANIKVILVTGDDEAEMRVHERGSGLTLSCGTGAVASAVAAAVAAGEWPGTAGRPWIVHVPGGSLTVTPSVTASLLTGPADIVATGEISDAWLAAWQARRLSLS